MINEIKRRLEDGETVELECIDREGFIDIAPVYNESILKSGLIVESAEDYRIEFKNCDYVVVHLEFKYFKIKEDKDDQVGANKMINEIKKRLASGETVELECIDEVGFLGFNDGLYYDQHKDVLESSLVVDYIDVDDEDDFTDIIFEDCNVISDDELQFFKIKEQQDKLPTFDDLIDVAVQAYKDGLLRSIAIENCSILITKNDYGKRFYKKGYDSYSEALKWINSLYTETFVIESEMDISRVKSGADIKLTNGNKCTFLNQDDMWRIKDDKGFSHNCGLLVLKGATVTQQRKEVEND